MRLFEEAARSRVGQFAGGVPLLDPVLDADVCETQLPEVLAVAVTRRVEDRAVGIRRRLDVAPPRRMPLDQIAAMALHDPRLVGQACQGLRRKSSAQSLGAAGYVGGEVRGRMRRLVQDHRLHATRGFESHQLPIWLHRLRRFDFRQRRAQHWFRNLRWHDRKLQATTPHDFLASFVARPTENFRSLLTGCGDLIFGRDERNIGSVIAVGAPERCKRRHRTILSRPSWRARRRISATCKQAAEIRFSAATSATLVL